MNIKLLENEKVLKNSNMNKKESLLYWQNISYSIETKSSTTKILNNISGYVKSNEVLAILGPSGSGKTSLLNILTSRYTPKGKEHKIIQSVKYNDITITNSNFGEYAAYIMQDDILFDMFTPFEVISFAANVKLPNYSSEEKKNRVETLIRDFGLVNCQNSRIGSIDSKGISGGEKKRTSIAYELISDPDVIILDEPTTGLDSYSSLILMKYLKKLAKQGKIIICTIHQPSYDIFSLIDRILVMKEGNIIYQGKTDNFEGYLKGFDIIMPDYCNPFDLCIELCLNREYIKYDLEEKYKNSMNLEVVEYLRKIKDNEEHSNDSIIKNKDSKALLKQDFSILSLLNWFIQLFYLTKRGFISYFRQKDLLYAKIFQFVLNNLILLSVFYDIGSKSRLSFYLASACFSVINNLFINGMFSCLLKIPVMKRILIRESSAKLYSTSAFYVSFLIILMIEALFASSAYSISIFYGMNIYKDVDKALIFFIISYFTWYLGQLFGMMFGSFFSDQLSLMISPFSFLIFILGSGFFRVGSSFPNSMKFILYISPYKYIMELMISIFENYNSLTSNIRKTFDFEFGIHNSLYVIAGLYAFMIVFIYFGVKYFSIKY